MLFIEYYYDLISNSLSKRKRNALASTCLAAKGVDTDSYRELIVRVASDPLLTVALDVFSCHAQGVR